MHRTLDIVEWFRDDIMPDVTCLPTVVLGGHSLLSEFMAVVGRSTDGGNLEMAVPYISKAGFRAVGTWHYMNHRLFQLRAVTASRTAADTIVEQLGIYPWKSFDVRIQRNLHSKIYVFLPAEGDRAALIGSHNMSYAAAARNDEAGVLFVSNGKDDLESVVAAWSRRVNELYRTGVDLADFEACLNANNSEAIIEEVIHDNSSRVS